MSYPFNRSFPPQALPSPIGFQQLEAFREKAQRIRDYIAQTQYEAQYQPYYTEQQPQQAPYYQTHPAQYQQYHLQQAQQHAQESRLPPPPFQQAIYQEPVRSSGPVPVHHQHQQHASASGKGGGRVAAHRANVSNRAAPYPSPSRPRVAPPPSATVTPGAVLKRSAAGHLIIPADDHRPLSEILGPRTRTTAAEKKQQHAEVKARMDALTACSRALLELEKKKKSGWKKLEKEREDEMRKAEEAASKAKGKKTRKTRVAQPSEEPSSSSSSLNSDQFVDASVFGLGPLPPSSPPPKAFDFSYHYNHFDAVSSPSSFASSSSTSSSETFHSSPLASSPSSSFGSPGPYGFASTQYDAYPLSSHSTFGLPQQQAEASFVVADQEEVLGLTGSEFAALYAQFSEGLQVSQG